MWAGDNAGNDSFSPPQLIWPVKIPLITEWEWNRGLCACSGRYLLIKTWLSFSSSFLRLGENGYWGEFSGPGVGWVWGCIWRSLLPLRSTSLADGVCLPPGSPSFHPREELTRELNLVLGWARCEPNVGQIHVLGQLLVPLTQSTKSATSSHLVSGLLSQWSPAPNMTVSSHQLKSNPSISYKRWIRGSDPETGSADYVCWGKN